MMVTITEKEASRILTAYLRGNGYVIDAPVRATMIDCDDPYGGIIFVCHLFVRDDVTLVYDMLPEKDDQVDDDIPEN